MGSTDGPDANIFHDPHVGTRCRKNAGHLLLRASNIQNFRVCLEMSLEEDERKVDRVMRSRGVYHSSFSAVSSDLSLQPTTLPYHSRHIISLGGST